MNTTFNNLIENNYICIIWWYIRLKWKVEVFDKGEYFDLCVAKSDWYTVSNALLVSIEDAFDLDKQLILKIFK